MDETAESHATLAGKLISRIGLGTMRLTGPGTWGYPPDKKRAIQTLRQAVDHGCSHLDTADSYGPHVAEHLIAEALFPYPPEILIATKGGFTRQGPNRWIPCGLPAYLRQSLEMSLRRLRVETIDLYYLHRIDPRVPLEDQVGTLHELASEGKIQHIGLSKTSIDQIQTAERITKISAVQNSFNLENRAQGIEVLNWCKEVGIPFICYAPLNSGKPLPPHILKLAANLDLTPESIALALILTENQNTFLIPGTCNPHHAINNMSTTDIANNQTLMRKISANRFTH